MVDAHGGDVAHANEFCCLGPAMSRNNSVGTINEDRTDKSKFFDARCNLLDLLCSVRARIPCPRLQLVGSLYVTFNAAMARLFQDRRKDQPPITFNAVTAAALRDRLVLDSATTDVILKMKRFPLLFSPCCPCYAEIGPCYFFRGISLETLMESAFVDAFVEFWPQVLRFSRVFCPVIQTC
jgi:hypothetical protein